jgi:putative addiction module component (TIGR02574 family)
MSLTIEQLREEALRLAPEDRARLASELISSLDALDEVDQASVDAAWADEVHQRMDDVRTGRVSLVEGDQVFQELRERLNK